MIDSKLRDSCIQGTLVGLLAAFSYELSILHSAARLTHADAFRTLHALYRERTHPLPAPASAASADGVSPSLSQAFLLLFYPLLTEIHILSAPVCVASTDGGLIYPSFTEVWLRVRLKVPVGTCMSLQPL